MLASVSAPFVLLRCPVSLASLLLGILAAEPITWVWERWGARGPVEPTGEQNSVQLSSVMARWWAYASARDWVCLWDTMRHEWGTSRCALFPCTFT